MIRSPSLGSGGVLGLRALLAGLAGVAGSYLAVGPTPAFLATPIESWLAANVPDYLLRVAITVVTPLGEAIGISHLGQALNLALAIGLATGLVGTLALAALATGRVRADTATTVGLALALPSVAGLLLTADITSALGAGLGTALVVALGEFTATDTSTTDAGRRDLLGSLAGAITLGLGGVLLGGRSTGSAATDGPRSLTENRDAPTGNESASAAEDGAAPDTSDGDGIEGLLATAERRSLSVPGLESLVSGEDFYEVDINSIDPDVGPEEWTLSIGGAVSNTIEIDYDDLRSMDAEHRFVTLRCVSDSLNGSEMDTALWTGVPIAEIIERAGPRGEHLRLNAADEYFQAFRRAELEEAMLVYGMDGTTLPRGHGAPVRLLVPGHWGEIQVKWIESIEVLTQPTQGFWEQRGWHGTGEAHTVAKLQATNRPAPGRIQVAGHAYAGIRGVRRVELSIDGGEWRETELSKPLPAGSGERTRGRDSARAAWRQWSHTYDSPGVEHELRVRTVEADGTIQPREPAEPYPRGATGWVSVTVDG